MLRPAIAAVLITACLAAASGDLVEPAKSQQATAPSQLDYLVLASMADSRHPLSMAAYRLNP